MGILDWFQRRPTDPTSRYMRAMSHIASRNKATLRPASRDELAKLASVGMREPILGLYAISVVDSSASTRMDAVIKSPEDILCECIELYPGHIVAPLGFIVIASTGCGDTFALDFNHVDVLGHPPVLLISHEDDFRSQTAEQIAESCPRVADSLMDFLELSLKPSKKLN